MSDAKTDKPLPHPAPRPSALSQPMWDAAKQGKLLLQYDRKAGKYQFFPRPLAIYSGSDEVEWREASGKGKLYAWTLVHVPLRGLEDVAPYVSAAVELDEGVRLMARIVDCDPKALKPGMRLRVAWDKVGDGSLSMFVFRPE